MSKQLFKTGVLDSTLLDMKHYVPDFLTSYILEIPVVFKTNVKNIEFWICSIIPKETIFKSFLLLSFLLHIFIVTSSEIGFCQCTALFLSLLHKLTKKTLTM